MKNKPTETNENGVNFYNADKLIFENAQIKIGETYPVFRCISYGGGIMFHKRYISSAAQEISDILRFLVPLCTVETVEKQSGGTYGVSYQNFTLSADTYETALKIAQTIISIKSRDRKAAFYTDRSTHKVYSSKTL